MVRCYSMYYLRYIYIIIMRNLFQFDICVIIVVVTIHDAAVNTDPDIVLYKVVLMVYKSQIPDYIIVRLRKAR